MPLYGITQPPKMSEKHQVALALGCVLLGSGIAVLTAAALQGATASSTLWVWVLGGALILASVLLLVYAAQLRPLQRLRHEWKLRHGGVPTRVPIAGDLLGSVIAFEGQSETQTQTQSQTQTGRKGQSQSQAQSQNQVDSPDP